MPERQARSLWQEIKKGVGQHPGILCAKNRNHNGSRVGQHPRMMGDHKTESRVNMDQNVQYRSKF